ncbi:CTP synthase (glutamine hydrolyzing) [Candidatus Woesearchaeota archaeon]|nr:CTP synthase (glutamine hydrolyzing) [Candidatus Woesearchaeota archaeon]
MNTKYIFITGGVVSGLGKGCVAASLGSLVLGKIITIKCDGYLNVDPGTINPYEHGEVFVLEDGGEVDMDFGHYERFLNINCKSSWNLTSGKIFYSLINKERKGEFLGKTIQIFPHVIDEIKNQWKSLVEQEKPDLCIIEIGGTVGDWENQWFIEAARQMRSAVGPANVLYTHLTYVPFLANVGELKTKPAQRDVALLREKGIIPDLIMCRSEQPLDAKIKDKLALFCSVERENVISVPDVRTIYELPILFKDQGVISILTNRFSIQTKNMAAWEKLVHSIKEPKHKVKIALCGKYTDLRDSYASVIEALVHAGAHLDCAVDIKLVETSAEKLDASGVDGILVPGGFGSRGTEGKMNLIKFAREKNVPYLGICFGLQLAVIEYARNVCNLERASSEELDTMTPHPVVVFLPGQSNSTAKGGTMRLGSCTAKLDPRSLVASLYGTPEAVERHRHRYEVNPEYHGILKQHGLCISGLSPDGKLAEYIELPGHPYFVATQGHNEFTSRLEKPNPLFYGFVKAALEKMLRAVKLQQV